jgi:hypothetical protein
MAYPKNSKSALLALAAAGGLWAWQNRNKLGGMLNQARDQINSQMSNGQMGQQPSRRKTIYDQHAPSVEAYTGGTRRIGDEANEI